MLKEIDSNIFPFKFRCVRCGNCCSHLPKGVPLFYSDCERISKHFAMNLYEFIAKHCELTLHDIMAEDHKINIPSLYLKTFDKRCIFYENGCLIHEVKPYCCKSAPFISLLFHDDNTIEFYKKHCRGFNKGIYYSKEKIKNILKHEIELEEVEWKTFNDGFYETLLKLFDKGGQDDTKSAKRQGY